jgi:phage N-6-adenine-methyltransferase
MVSKVLFSSKSDEWETPQKLFNELNKEFNFKVDIAASPDNHKCDSYIDAEHDALKYSWHLWTILHGWLWCNPPYSTSKLWIKKAHEESLKGAKIVMLLPARTDTAAFHDYIYGKHEIRFLRGRLKFGNSKNSAPFPSMIVIFQRA